MAMEYYGIRKAGKDIDFIVTEKDYEELANLYPNNLKDIFGDKGIIIFEFEIWKTIVSFDYNFLSEHSTEKENYKIISLEKLLFMKAIGIKKKKYEKDLRMIVNKIIMLRYPL